MAKFHLVLGLDLRDMTMVIGKVTRLHLRTGWDGKPKSSWRGWNRYLITPDKGQSVLTFAKEKDSVASTSRPNM
jgi:hypothetical protein